MLLLLVRAQQGIVLQFLVVGPHLVQSSLARHRHPRLLLLRLPLPLPLMLMLEFPDRLNGLPRHSDTQAHMCVVRGKE